MLQNSHGMSIPALVPPCFEEPGYGINTSVSRPPFSICQPHVTGSNGIAPSARVLQEVMFPNEMNYPSYIPDIPSNQGLALPWMSSWHQRQNLQYLGHPHPGKIIVSIFFTTGIKPHSICFELNDYLLRKTCWSHLEPFKNLSIYLNSTCSLIVVVILFVLLELLKLFA